MTSGQQGQTGMYRPDMEHENCGVGFVARLDGVPNHEIISQGLEILKKLSHRGAVGSDSETGDGAGLLIQIPDKFFRKQALKSGFVLPEQGDYGVGMIFMPKEPHARFYCEGVVERIAEELGLAVLGWREVPVYENACGPSARGTCPTVCQVFVNGCGKQGLDLERGLYLLRRKAEKGILESGRAYTETFYVCSLSTTVIVYKGQFLAHQIESFFPELKDETLESALAVVHQRYSTNTFPSWKLAHPYRYLAHNGEINTIRGNQQWFHARESLLGSEWFGYDTELLKPVLQPGCSDSGNLDNAFEFLTLSGYSMAHAMRLLIPEVWRDNPEMTREACGMYSYLETQMEPWDGPAAVVFTNGSQVGACLDRNGLRPARYVITKDKQVVLASEAGVLNISEDRILKRGKLGPGQMILADLQTGEVSDSKAILDALTKQYDYAGWEEVSRKTLGTIENTQWLGDLDRVTAQRAFGYTEETLKRVLAPLLTEGHEAMSSMGNDAPPAVLSVQPRRLFDYFRQLFAQVTNPPIDPIREKRVTTLHQQMGGPNGMLKKDPWDQRERYLELDGPVIGIETLQWICSSAIQEMQAIQLPMVFEADTGEDGLKHALEVLKNRAEEAVRQGYRVLVLTDRPFDRFHAPVPSLLAVSVVHQHLLTCQSRMQVDIVVESGEVLDPFHSALLVGFGATAVCPWLALESLKEMGETGLYTEKMEWEAVRKKALAAYEDGVLRIISKMGISTLKSFSGAKIFESIGLGNEMVQQYFPGLMNRLPSVEIETLAQETIDVHRNAYDPTVRAETLPIGGTVHWRRGGERHLMDPECIQWLQEACRNGDEALYRQYAHRINESGDAPVTLRNLLKFKNQRTSIPLEAVEGEASLMRRFATGAMSFGSLSREMHETLALAMNRVGGRSNSGEGGEDPERFKRPASGDYRGSMIKQVAAARFGVTAEYLVHAEELQIKVAQGAKPGEGGHLPGEKVTEDIGKVRHALPGITLISPPPHHDIYSIEDLEQLIFDLKCVNPMARISVKLVSEIGVGTVAAGVAKGNADVILISGHDGGTGAAPLTSIKTAGIPWEMGLAEAHQTLLLNNLRGRVTVQVDGQLRTGRDVAVAALLGAEEFAFATAPLIVCGCIQMRKCHENTCPVGIATQDPELRKNFQGKPEHVIQYFRFVIAELREIMASLGFATLDEMVGRSDLLEQDTSRGTDKVKKMNLSAILARPELPMRFALRKIEAQPSQTEDILDKTLIRDIPDHLSGTGPESYVIQNTDRSVGAMLSGELVRRYGDHLAEKQMELWFRGSAGQSFGAFLPKGVSFRLVGEANDYLGKGLSGGRISVRFPENSVLKPEENIIAGNTLLYGATRGEVYLSGRVGERFAVRNSGVLAVVEGVGDHGCEYMTGGRVAILGTVGWNFGAGMSGGVAYVYDKDGSLERRCNRQMVDIYGLDERSEAELQDMLWKHWNYTDSALAKFILDNWQTEQYRFAQVVSPTYKKLLEAVELKSRQEVG